MKRSIAFLLMSVVFLALPAYAAKQRVIVLTDIENEPDDTQSMIRFLTYSNHWDIEGLIATTSVHQRDKTAAAVSLLLPALQRFSRTNSRSGPRALPFDRDSEGSTSSDAGDESVQRALVAI